MKIICFLFMLISYSAFAIQCVDRINSSYEIEAKNRSVSEVVVADCRLDGVKGIHLSGLLDSDLVNARGELKVVFFGRSNRLIHSHNVGPWIGNYAKLSLDESFLVPDDALRVKVLAMVSGRSGRVSGAWGVTDLRVNSGARLQAQLSNGAVFAYGQSVRLSYSLIPAYGEENIVFELVDVAGNKVDSVTLAYQADRNHIDFGVLPVGYYDLTLSVFNEGVRSNKEVISFVVIPDGDPPRDVRFGIDAALTRVNDIKNSLPVFVDLMSKAGVGSVRDRMSWAQVQGSRGSVNWGVSLDVAKAISEAGMDMVQVFHDSPAWTRDDVSDSNDRYPPSDYDAVFSFGKEYALGLGKYVRNVEYWNEQNSDFFKGYPFQYVNGLKAFYAGVKSVDPGIRVLIGSAASSPGAFFDEIYASGAANFFDIRNQHFYGASADVERFHQESVASVERIGGVSEYPGWLTEMGFSVRRGIDGTFKIAELKQAEYLVKTYVSGFSAGYERVFFFMLRELIERERDIWGILRSDLSPRPAYLTLALLTRHLRDAEFVGSEFYGTGQIYFFRKFDESYVAVAWGGGAVVNGLGLDVKAVDVFGRTLLLGSIDPESTAPVFISGIKKLPVNVRPVISTTRVRSNENNIRLEVDVRINGGRVEGPLSNRIRVPVIENGIVTVFGKLYSDEFTHSDADIECVAGRGVSFDTLDYRPSSGAARVDRFSCQFRTQLADIGSSSVTVIARKAGQVDSVRVALLPDPASAGAVRIGSAFKPSGRCPRWVENSSSNVQSTLRLIASNTASCKPFAVSSYITKVGQAWVFPKAILRDSDLKGAVGLRLRISPLIGYPFPPTALMLQLIDTGGRTWLVDLKAGDGGKDFTGLFRIARLAPWSRSAFKEIDLREVNQILVGWGGYRGEAGERYGFVVETLDLF